MASVRMYSMEVSAWKFGTEEKDRPGYFYSFISIWKKKCPWMYGSKIMEVWD